MTAGRLFRRSIAAVAITFALGAVTAGVASAQEDSNPQGAYVGGTTLVKETPKVAPAAPAAQVGAATTSRGASAASNAASSLAFTGGDVAGLALLGAVALVIGGVLVTSRRRSPRTA